MAQNKGPLLTSVFKGLLDLVPAEFRAKFGVTRTEQAEDAATTTPSNLTGGVVASSVEQEHTNEKKKIVETLNTTSGSLTSYRLTEDQQVETITRSLDATPTITPTATTSSGEVRDLGIGLKEKAEGVVSEVFDEQSNENFVPDIMPEKFAVGATITESETTSAGTTATADAVGSGLTGVLGSLARRITALKVRLRTRTRTKSLPATLTGSKITNEYGGGIVDVAETLASTIQTLTPGLRVVSGEVQTLGGTASLKRVETLQNSTWPILQGTHVDPETGITVDYTKQVVDDGTTGGISGNDYIEVEPLDFEHSLKITSTLRVNTLPADKQYPVTQRESFPDVLKDVELFVDPKNPVAPTDPSLIQAFNAYNKVEGYSGPCNARITEKFMTVAQLDSWATTNVGTIHPRKPSVTQFFPQANRLRLRLAGGTIVYTGEFPVSLHGRYTETLLGGSLSLPKTKPEDLPYDTWIVVTIRVSKLRFGVRLVEVVEVQVPPDPNNEQ